MTLNEIEAYCVSKPGAYPDWPFGPQFPVVKVKAPSQEKGRIFGKLAKKVQRELEAAHEA